jgi:hypothetical protein
MTPNQETRIEQFMSSPTIITENASELTEKSLFLRVSYGNLGNSKKVPGAGILTTDADKTLLRVSKALLDSPELDAIKHHDNSLRKWLNNICLPFLDWPGVLVMPKTQTQRVWTRLRQHREERHELVASFVALYPTLKEKAKEELGSLYVEGDYPPVQEISQRFRFYWTIRTFETPDHLKEISEELFEEQKAATQAQFSAAMEEISNVLRTKAFELFDHLREKLQDTADGKPKVLRESTIVALKEFMDSFDFRNLSNDTELAAQITKARELLGDESAITLRSSNELRAKVKKGMEELTGTLSTMVEEQPIRKFRLDED